MTITIVQPWVGRSLISASAPRLTAGDIDELESRGRDLVLPNLEVSVATLNGDVAGWIGMQDGHVQALFVDPSAHRRDVGQALLTSGTASFPVVTVNANEQNPEALASTKRRGPRSDLDGDGRPCPLIHLRRARHPAS